MSTTSSAESFGAPSRWPLSWSVSYEQKETPLQPDVRSKGKKRGFTLLSTTIDNNLTITIRKEDTMKHIVKHISAYRSRRRSITSTLNHYQVLLCTDPVRQEWVSCTTHSIEESPSNRCCRYKGEKDDLSVGRIPQYQLSIGDIMKQLIKQALGVQPRKMPLQTRSVQLRVRYKTTTVAKKQSKLWAFAQNASALVTLGQLFKDLLTLLLANL